MAGEHNALNATAAAALAAGQGIPAAAITEALATFQSVKRRLEVRAEINGITIIDDFAHHPTAIRETLRALRAAYPGRRLFAVLEPRSNTLRRNVFERELVDSLALADEVILAAVFKSEAIPVLERLDPEHVIAALNARNIPAILCPTPTPSSANLAPRLAPQRRSRHPLQRRLRQHLRKTPRRPHQRSRSSSVPHRSPSMCRRR